MALDATTETDWGHKSAAGREVLVAITVWDDEPVRHDTCRQHALRGQRRRRGELSVPAGPDGR